MPDENNNTLVTDSEKMLEGSVTFSLRDQPEFIVFKQNGDIFIRGVLVENDKDVVQGFREFLGAAGYYPQGCRPA